MALGTSAALLQGWILGIPERYGWRRSRDFESCLSETRPFIGSVASRNIAGDSVPNPAQTRNRLVRAADWAGHEASREQAGTSDDARCLRQPTRPVFVRPEIDQVAALIIATQRLGVMKMKCKRSETDTAGRDA